MEQKDLSDEERDRIEALEQMRILLEVDTDQIWLFDSENYDADLSKLKFYQAARPDKLYTFKQLQRFKEVFGWETVLIMPNDDR